ncbi:MAG: hypothetical protein ABJF67_13020 [Aurantimonas coralicida]
MSGSRRGEPIPDSGEPGALAERRFRAKLEEHHAYIVDHGGDMPEIAGWHWSPGKGADAGD